MFIIWGFQLTIWPPVLTPSLSLGPGADVCCICSSQFSKDHNQSPPLMTHEPHLSGLTVINIGSQDDFLNQIKQQWDEPDLKTLFCLRNVPVKPSDWSWGPSPGFWLADLVAAESVCLRQPVYVMVTGQDQVTNCKQLKQLKQLETDW